jgi:hypothetical protein
MMARLRIAAAISGFILCSAAGIYLWPQARDAARLLLAQDDPVALADLQLASVMQNDRAAIQKQIETALADGDSDLAQSFVELAQGRNVALPDELTARVAARVAEDTSTLSTARRFAAGFVTGDVNDMASLSGTVAGDLFVYGDIRDMVREGTRLASGEEADHLILGLAAAGIAVTAATYASAGTAAPMRAGLSLVKGARKAGRISEGLAKWGTRSAREMVDAPALRHAVGAVSVARPANSVVMLKTAFKAEKAGALVRLGKDVGRITGKAGGRGAMDVLKVAQGPKDVARAARLAEANGGATRAILKLLGRGALVLASGAFNLTMWLFGALMTLVGILVSIKSGTERLTQMWYNRRRRRRNKALMRELRNAQDRLAIAV